MRFFMMIQFISSIFGLYFVHFMAPMMETSFPSWLMSFIVGLSIGSIAATVHRFFEDVSAIRVTLESKQ